VNKNYYPEDRERESARDTHRVCCWVSLLSIKIVKTLTKCRKKITVHYQNRQEEQLFKEKMKSHHKKNNVSVIQGEQQ
jgi:hypothetical protein